MSEGREWEFGSVVVGFRVLGRPDLPSRGPKMLILKGSGTFGQKIGRPKNANPTTTDPIPHSRPSDNVQTTRTKDFTQTNSQGLVCVPPPPFCKKNTYAKTILRDYWGTKNQPEVFQTEVFSWTSAWDVRSETLVFPGFGGPDRSFWRDVRRDVRPKTSSLG